MKTAGTPAIRRFYDTSVLVAAVQRIHPNHAESLKALSLASKRDAACGAHTVAETFSVLTRMPPPHRVPPEAAWVFLGQIRERLTIITLDEEDYFATMEQTVAAKRAGALIFDALLLQCARKANAERIYTWNARHFRAIAPDLAGRIAEP